MKNKLIASAPNAGELLKMVAQYFVVSLDDILLHEKVMSDGTTERTIYRKSTGRYYSSYVVTVKKDRYRFELVTAQKEALSA